nr:DNA methyltransferase [Pseudenhygromyxa sp. WMMC2535]
MREREHLLPAALSDPSSAEPEPDPAAPSDPISAELEPAAPDLSPLGPAALILGDNLLALEALVRAHPERADLIYIDPPFATGSRFALARRLGEDDNTGELRLPAFDDAWEDGLAGFLRMLDPRLRLLHRLLAPTGSLYLHVDPTVGHAVKLLLDEIFGPGCFQREIVWRIGWLSGFKTRARNWIRNHDLIFFYTKDPRAFTFNKRWVPHPKGYKRRDGKPSKAPGVPMEDVWNANAVEADLRGKASLDSIQIKSFSREKTGWATQKNESLLRRIIEASSNPGDLVVDVFAGSGTTAAVATALGRRVWTCDHAEAAVQITRARLLDAGVADLRVFELDARERSLRLAEVEPGQLRAWLLAQLGADPAAPSGASAAREGDPAGADAADHASVLEGDADAPVFARRGDVALVVAPPGLRVDDDLRAAALEHARALGCASVELLAFDWPLPLAERTTTATTPTTTAAPTSPDSTGAPLLIELEPTRGLFEASVRACPWIHGGVAIRERPRVRVALEPLAEAPDGSDSDSSSPSAQPRAGLGRARATLIEVTWQRPEHLPEPLRARPFHERLLGWSLALAEAPTAPLALAWRERGRGPLELSATLDIPCAGPSASELRLSIEDVLGHRTQLRVVHGATR